MYPNENNIQGEKWTKINLLFRTEMKSLDHFSCFIFYIHGMSPNILLQNGKHKWEFSTHLIVLSVVGTGKQQCSFPRFSKHFW